MALWSKNISDEEIFSMLPEQCFPDVEEMKVRITSKEIQICGSGSEWALQSDIILAAGAGCMFFSFTGDLQFEMNTNTGRRVLSLPELQNLDSPALESVQLIKRGTPWEFLFSSVGQGVVKVYAEVTGMSWNPEED